MRSAVLVVIASLFLISPLMAKKPVEKAVIADTPEKFEVLVEKIRSQMAPGEKYEFLKAKDREIVNGHLDRMAEMLVKAGSVEAMQPEEKAKLFSEQEEVNGILARNADDRLVCTHVAPVGSHLPVTTCHTVRELAQSRENYRRQKVEFDNQGRIGPGGG
jgi:hypothetical protein